MLTDHNPIQTRLMSRIIPSLATGNETGRNAFLVCTRMDEGEIPMRGFIIGVLIAALAALAYIYYVDENTITIETPEAPNVRTN